MPWLRELAVARGEVWLKPGGEDDLWDVEGLLDLQEPFRVWFRDIDRTIAFADTDPGRTYQVRKGRIAIESGLEPEAPQPEDLSELLQLLLCPQPDEGEESYGYIFSAQLPLDVGETLTIRFKDTTHWGREGTFVEFARYQEPFALIAHERFRVFQEPRERFETIIRLQGGWPLHHQ
jgi:hypothetical protein